MRTIYLKDYHNEGILIDLDVSFKPYENLLNNHYKYLNKNKEYYFTCKTGTKARRVASILEAYGYKTNIVLK